MEPPNVFDLANLVTLKHAIWVEGVLQVNEIIHRFTLPVVSETSVFINGRTRVGEGRCGETGGARRGWCAGRFILKWQAVRGMEGGGSRGGPAGWDGIALRRGGVVGMVGSEGKELWRDGQGREAGCVTLQKCKTLVKETWYGPRDGLGLGQRDKDLALGVPSLVLLMGSAVLQPRLIHAHYFTGSLIQKEACHQDDSPIQQNGLMVHRHDTFVDWRHSSVDHERLAPFA
ncbi:hypothetical protein Tco_0157869 [Tanacetum coccineum]